jgi:hypothetical protein
MARHRKQQQGTVARASGSPERQAPATSRRARGVVRSWRIGRLIAAWVVLTIVTVVAAPVLIGKTQLLNHLIAWAAGGFQGRICVGSARLSWFAPIQLDQIEIIGLDGSPLGSIGSITTSSTLAELLLARNGVGKFSIYRPTLQVVVSTDGSNWETACARLLTGSETSRKLAFEIEVINGQIDLLQQSTRQQTSLTAVNLKGYVPANRVADPITVELEACTGLSEPDGNVVISASLKGSEASQDLSKGNVRISARSASLAAIEPLLPRLGMALNSVDGLVTANIKAGWDMTKRVSFDVEGNVDLTDLSARSKWLNRNEAFQLESASLKIQLAASKDQVDIQQLELTSSLGRIDMAGSAPARTDLLDRPLDFLRRAADSGGLSISGNLDIAALAQALPQSLRLRNGSHIETGELHLKLSAEPIDDGQRLAGHLRATDLIATRSGNRLKFKEPVQLEFGILEKNGDINIEKCVGQSTFVSFLVRGDKSSGQFAAQADLKRFQSQFQEIFDLDACEFDGRVGLQTRWHGTGDDSIVAEGKAFAQQLNVVIGGRTMLSEPRLDSTIRATGRLDGTRITELTDAEFAIRSGSERLSLKLARPLAPPWPMSNVSAHLDFDGDLAVLQRRLAMVMPKSELQLAGHVRMRSQAALTDTVIEFAKVEIELANLRAKTASQEFFEKCLQIHGDVQLHRPAFELTVPSATLVSSSMALRAKELRFGWDEAGPRFSGTVHYRGELQRIGQLAGSGNSGRMATGELTGSLEVDQSGSTVSFDLAADCQNLQLLGLRSIPGKTTRNGSQTAEPWRTIWREPTVKLGANGRFDRASRSAILDRVEITAQPLRVSARGSIDQSSEQIACDIQGTADYNLDTLSSRLQEYLGEAIQLSGRTSRPFLIKGPIGSKIGRSTETLLTSRASQHPADQKPLVSPELVARAGIGWTKGSIYGISLGGSSIDARLAQQQVVIEPFTSAAGAGRVSLSPRIDLSGGPLLTLAEGRILDDIQLTPELCRRWMKFVAPLLAEATEADGRFSLDLHDASIPLATPTTGRLRGQLQIHQARVRPGPLAREFLSVAQQIKNLTRRGNSSRIFDPERSVVSMPSQQIHFRLHDGQVDHEGLVMHIGDVEVRTAGWVSLNERLAVTAHIPIQDDWIDDQRLLAGLRGQVLTIPVTGTLPNPKLDSTALGQLTRKAVVGAAEGFLQQELEKQVGRLFRPR